MSKRLLVLATITFAITFAAVPLASADNLCPSTNWQDYLNLNGGVGGFTSCHIGNLDFNSFSFASAPLATIPTSPSSVAVSIITTPGNEGFSFNPAIIVSGNGNNVSQDFALDFNVTALNAVLTGLSIQFNGSVIAPGFTAFSETVTGANFPGAPFISVTNPPAGNSGPLNVAFTTPVTTIHVVKEIGGQSGTFGAAAISQVTNQFSNRVPEPATLTLLGIGLAGLLGFGVRRKS